MLRHCVGFSNYFFDAEEQNHDLNLHSSEHLFLYIYLSLFSSLFSSPAPDPSQPRTAVPANLACALGIHTMCWLSQAYELWCAEYGGRQLIGPLAEAALSQATHSWAVAPAFEITVYTETAQNWRSHHTLQFECLRSAHPGASWHQRDRLTSLGSYCRLMLFFPFTVMLVPDRERYTGNEFYL